MVGVSSIPVLNILSDIHRHFKQIGSPLLGIHDFPTIANQVQRHRERGLTTTAATTLCRFYYNCIADKTRAMIEKLEVFDEFEAWHRACQHYVVLCSTNSKDIQLENLVTCMFGDTSKCASKKLNTMWREANCPSDKFIQCPHCLHWRT